LPFGEGGSNEEMQFSHDQRPPQLFETGWSAQSPPYQSPLQGRQVHTSKFNPLRREKAQRFPFVIWIKDFQGGRRNFNTRRRNERKASRLKAAWRLLLEKQPPLIINITSY
jgi:hypothetical protein